MTVANPFQDPLRFERRVPECTVVIFGADGDLTKRKLMPALYRLMYERRLSPGFAVVGVSRTPMSHHQFRDKMRESVQNIWKTRYVCGRARTLNLSGKERRSCQKAPK